jgi:hypothetical protein
MGATERTMNLAKSGWVSRNWQEQNKKGMYNDPLMVKRFSGTTDIEKRIILKQMGLDKSETTHTLHINFVVTSGGKESKYIFALMNNRSGRFVKTLTSDRLNITSFRRSLLNEGKISEDIKSVNIVTDSIISSQERFIIGLLAGDYSIKEKSLSFRFNGEKIKEPELISERSEPSISDNWMMGFFRMKSSFAHTVAVLSTVFSFALVSCSSGGNKVPVDEVSQNDEDAENINDFDTDEEPDTYTDDVTDDYVDEEPDVDPLLCEDGEVRYVSCGINGNGEQAEYCENEEWYLLGECEDSDVCKNGDSEPIQAWNTIIDGCDICGFAKCEDGQWKMPSESGLMDHCEYREEEGPEGLPNGIDDNCSGIVDDKFFITIPEGEFLQSYDNFPIFLPEFKIMKYEVTRKQWQECVNAKVCTSTEDITVGGELERPDHPINNIHAMDLEHFCRNYIGGGATDDDGNFIVDLPTYSQWEKSAAGPDGDRFPWGDEVPGGNSETENCELMNYRGCYNDFFVADARTTPVGYFNGENKTREGETTEDVKSPYGLRDVTGNVAEFVRHTDLDPYTNGEFRTKGGSFMSNTQFDCTMYGGDDMYPDTKCRSPQIDKTTVGVEIGGRCVYNNK